MYNLYGRSFFYGTYTEMIAFIPSREVARFYCTDTTEFYIWYGTEWHKIGPGTGGSGTPSNTVVDGTTFGQTPVPGSATAYSRGDHGHGTPTNPIVEHVAASDPHTVYQKENEKDTANGYAGLSSNSLVSTAHLGTGTPNTSTYLRGDQTWQEIAGGGLSQAQVLIRVSLGV
jgi:hypothetical protein